MKKISYGLPTVKNKKEEILEKTNIKETQIENLLFLIEKNYNNNIEKNKIKHLTQLEEQNKTSDQNMKILIKDYILKFTKN